MDCGTCEKKPALVRRFIGEQGKPLAQLKPSTLEQLGKLLQKTIGDCAECPDTPEIQAARADLEYLLRQVEVASLPAPSTTMLPSPSRVPPVCRPCTTPRFIEVAGKTIDRYTTLSTSDIASMSLPQRRRLGQLAQQSLDECRACLSNCGSECDPMLMKQAQHRRTIDTLTLERLGM